MSAFSCNVPSRRASASVIDACGKASLARLAQSASGFGPSAHAGESPVATPFKMTRAVPTDTLKRIASLRFRLGRPTLTLFPRGNLHPTVSRCTAQQTGVRIYEYFDHWYAVRSESPI